MRFFHSNLIKAPSFRIWCHLVLSASHSLTTNISKCVFIIISDTFNFDEINKTLKEYFDLYSKDDNAYFCTNFQFRKHFIVKIWEKKKENVVSVNKWRKRLLVLFFCVSDTMSIRHLQLLTCNKCGDYDNTCNQ